MEDRKMGSLTWIFVVAMLMAAAIVVIGLRPAMMGSFSLLAAGSLGFIISVIAWAVTSNLVAAFQESNSHWKEYNDQFTERMEQFSVMLNLISEQQLISDRGKTVAFRDKDREALYRAIREEMSRQQWDAALVLVNDMDVAFGYKQEAEKLRQEILELRDATVRKAVAEANVLIDRACASENWDEGLQIAERLNTVYPEHELVVNLPNQIQERKEVFKQQLLKSWQDAVARKDIDGSAEILRQLDMYVTHDEVVQLREGAVEIFKARIERLREQFKTSVHEKRWSKAMGIGEDIIADYPTSKLAQEVRDMMDTMRQNAAKEAVTAGA